LVHLFALNKSGVFDRWRGFVGYYVAAKEIAGKGAYGKEDLRGEEYFG
jgi:hypothetical protein